MAGAHSIAVIYIIIANKMKTLLNISTARNKSYIARVRSVLTFVGIVTAIICSLVLLQDVNAAERSGEVSGPRSMETSKFGNVQLLVKAAATMLEVR